MPRPSIKWLITDTHFNHDAMVTMCGRPPNFKDLIIKNLRHNLAEQDMLIHLGDVIFYQYDTLKEILDSIPGTKILAMGNHDRRSAGWYMRHGFHFAAEMFQIDDIVFSHKPIYPLPSSVRLNIHGHWHNTMHHGLPDFYDPNKYRLLAIENTNYMPVKLVEFAK